MSDFIKRKKAEQSMLHTGSMSHTADMSHKMPKVYSTADPTDPVTSITSICLKRNRFQDDLWTAAAKQMNISKQQFIRVACDKLCDELDIR